MHTFFFKFIPHFEYLCVIFHHLAVYVSCLACNCENKFSKAGVNHKKTIKKKLFCIKWC